MNVKKITKITQFITAAIFTASLAILPMNLPKVQAASVSSYGVTVADAMNGASGADHLFTVSSASGIPASGSVEITYPSGFNVSAAYIDISSYPESATTRNGQTLSVSASADVPANFSLIVYNVVNGSAGDHVLSLVIKDASGTVIDSGSSTLHIVGNVDRFEFLPSSTISKKAGENFTITVKAYSGNDIAYTPSAISLVSNPSGSGLSVNSFYLTENGYKILTVYMTKAGSYTLTASADGVSGSSNTINISHAATNSVSVSPSSATINVGQTKQFSAIASDAFGNSWDVTETANWSASGGTISAGLYTGKTAGTFTVTASIDGKSGSASITVNQTQTGSGEQKKQGQGGAIAYQPQTQVETAVTKQPTPSVTPTETAKTKDTSKNAEAAKEEAKPANRTIEKIVLAIVALALLGTSAYFLFKKSPEDNLPNESSGSGDIKITPAEEIIKKAEEAVKKSEEQKKDEREKKLKK